jgi:hypothetical protein
VVIRRGAHDEPVDGSAFAGHIQQTNRVVVSVHDETDSPGRSVPARARHAADEHGMDFVLVDPSPEIEWRLSLTGLSLAAPAG